jgi:hypothetical protein
MKSPIIFKLQSLRGYLYVRLVILAFLTFALFFVDKEREIDVKLCIICCTLFVLYFTGIWGSNDMFCSCDKITIRNFYTNTSQIIDLSDVKKIHILQLTPVMLSLKIEAHSEFSFTFWINSKEKLEGLEKFFFKYCPRCA